MWLTGCIVMAKESVLAAFPKWKTQWVIEAVFLTGMMLMFGLYRICFFCKPGTGL